MNVVGVEVEDVEATGLLAHLFDLQDRVGQRIRWVGSSRNAACEHGSRWAQVTESPLANKVTSCPIATSSSVSHATTRSVPP